MINWIKHEKKIMIGIMTLVIVIGIIGCINFFNRNQLKQIQDTYTHEAGQELVLDPADFFEVDEEKAAQVTFDTSTVNKDMVGEYVATAKFKNKTFEIKVTVVDTTAPMVEFSNRYVFTNDIENPNFDGTFAGVYDASEWSAKLIRFEYKENLSVLDENALKRFTDTIPVPCEEEELMAIGTTDIPTEEGVYRAVLEIADVHGNYSVEEVYMIYDTTGARIDDTPDKTVTVAKEDIEKEPEVDKTDYVITDNVDGDIPSEDINCELELRDAEKHEWLVYVSYVDRAGNSSEAKFLIIVEEGDVPSENDEQTSNPDNSNDNANNDTTSNKGSGNGGTTSNNGNTNNTGSGDSGNYDPADTNKDGVITSDEAAANISPSEQAMIDAGYGNVVQLPTGNYGVLMQGPDHAINGKDGGDILIDYLAERGLQAGDVTGGWMNDQYYNWIAKNITEIDTSDSLQGGEIIFGDE